MQSWVIKMPVNNQAFTLQSEKGTKAVTGFVRKYIFVTKECILVPNVHIYLYLNGI